MICEKCEALSALIDGYRRERDEAQARVIDAALIHADLVRERDEARAEAKRRLDELNMVQSQLTLALHARDEARAEVQDYREQLRKLPDANRVASQDAYRRGAEAMRDAAANALHMAGHGTLCDTSECEHWGRYVRALPIPEEP